jgi:gliding motility-associated-like protein
LTVNAQGNYRLIVTNADGCADTSAAITVSVTQTQEFRISPPNTRVCIGGTFTLKATGYIPGSIVRFVWLRGATVVRETTADSVVLTGSGTYTVEGVTSTNTRIPALGTAVVNENPDLDTRYAILNGSAELCTGDTARFRALGDTTLFTFEWLKDGVVVNKGINFSVTEAGNYALTVKDRSLCAKTTPAINVIFKDQPIVYNIPNVFTPNGDGVNDKFEVTISKLEDYRISIFDRFGKLVYRATDPNQHWNGANGGVGEVPPGVYFYTIEGKRACGTNFTKTGSVTLVR